MSKRVVSFRLSDQEVEALDRACRLLDKNRSEVVAAGISVLLRDYVHENGALIKRTPWFLTPLAASAQDDKA